jgi:NAD(P)-dependent dehydrogenase (short-subunit alcohol dehydrogenase family)
MPATGGLDDVDDCPADLQYGQPGRVNRFEGRVAIVAGASTDPGIGTACARRLAEEGASVVINARNEERLRTTESTLRAAGLEVTAVPGSADEVASLLVDRALDRYGRIDLLVNAVGGSPSPTSPLTLSKKVLLDTFALNTWPTLSLIQAAVGGGLTQHEGAIVNISSTSPKKTTLTMAAYAASKAGLNALTRTLAGELAAAGVRVNAVSPGLTRTEVTRSLWEPDGGANAGRNLPLGRITRAEDIAAAVTFLLSDDARAITGVVLDVDGGNHLTGGGWSPFASAK